RTNMFSNGPVGNTANADHQRAHNCNHEEKCPDKSGQDVIFHCSHGAKCVAKFDRRVVCHAYLRERVLCLEVPRDGGREFERTIPLVLTKLYSVRGRRGASWRPRVTVSSTNAEVTNMSASNILPVDNMAVGRRGT